jgi:hypothetical protein
VYINKKEYTTSASRELKCNLFLWAQRDYFLTFSRNFLL